MQTDCMGISINYVDLGKGDPMLFLHNGGGFWQIWIHQIMHFSKKYRVLAFDWPGFGNSAEISEPLSLDLYFKVLTTFVDNLGLDRIILVGNCIGASVAIQYRYHYPDKVRYLVLMNICPGKRLIRLGIMRWLLFTFGKKRDMKALKSILGFLFTRTPVKRIFPRILFGKSLRKDDFLYNKYVVKFKEARQTRARLNLLFASDSYTLEDFVRRDKDISDSLLIWGERNRVAGLRREGFYHQKMCGIITMKIIKEAGHLLMYESPDEVNTLIEGFIREENDV